MSGKYYDDCHHHQQKEASSSQVSFFGCTDSTVLISEQRDRTPRVATRAGAGADVVCSAACSAA